MDDPDAAPDLGLAGLSPEFQAMLGGMAGHTASFAKILVRPLGCFVQWRVVFGWCLKWRGCLGLLGRMLLFVIIYCGWTTSGSKNVGVLSITPPICDYFFLFVLGLSIVSDV